MRIAWWAGLALAVAAGAPAGADEWSQRYSVTGTPSVTVRTNDGSVRVTAGTSGAVEARVTTEGWQIGPGDVTIRESQQGDRIEIEARVPRTLFGFSGGHRSLEITLRLPERTDLDVRSGDGSIKVRDVSGTITLSSGDGSITAEDLHGELKLHTGDGSISGTGLSGRLAADTGDGRVDVSGRFEGLDLHTGDGGIDASAEAGSKVAEGGWSLRTGDGGITLRLPEGLDAELDAQTGDGRIVLDRPVTVTGTIKRSSVHGTLGAGGAPLRVRTGDGSIRLTAAAHR